MTKPLTGSSAGRVAVVTGAAQGIGEAIAHRLALDVEILALRHQLAVLRRQLGDQRPRLRPEDRASLPGRCVAAALKAVPGPHRHARTSHPYPYP